MKIIRCKGDTQYDKIENRTTKGLGHYKKYLTSEGIVLVPESVAKEVKCDKFDDKSIDYDFGGEADYWVDVVLDEKHIALESL